MEYSESLLFGEALPYLERKQIQDAHCFVSYEHEEYTGTCFKTWSIRYLFLIHFSLFHATWV